MVANAGGQCRILASTRVMSSSPCCRSVATQAHVRSHAEILRFFDGFELVEPGLVYVPLWRPDSPADIPSDPAKFWCQAGVGRKP